MDLKLNKFLASLLIILSTLFLLWVIPVLYWDFINPDITWDWSKIDTDDIHFPESFAWGTATAAHQVEGNNTNNNWYQWENSFLYNVKLLPKKNHH